jgi:RimJ/RimL family protein N-acetyltransferase
MDFKLYSELFHYGVKGMHWGIRRYQNADGTLTAEGKEHNRYRKQTINAYSTSKDVNDIIKSMNKDDRDKVLAGSDHYLNKEEGSSVVKRIIKKVDGKPVAFFDLLEDGEELQLALGTRSGKKYRGKGYGSEVTKQAMDWVEKNKHKLKQKRIVWGVRKDNTASIRLAEKNGFKYQKGSENDGWVNYVKEINKGGHDNG